MRPIPWDVGGIRVPDIARQRLRSIQHGLAVRSIAIAVPVAIAVVTNVVSGQEDGSLLPAAMMPEVTRHAVGAEMRPSVEGASRSGEGLVGG